MMRIIAAVLLAVGMSACTENKENTKVSSRIDTKICDATTVVINENFRPIRTLFLLEAPTNSGAKVINQKATKALKETHYHSISGASVVLEQCQKKGFSYVSMTEPEWLKGVSGWVPTDALKKKTNPDDPYEGRIAEWILDKARYQKPITDDNGKVMRAFSGKLPDIRSQSIIAAKKAVDSGLCAYVESAIFDRLASKRNDYSFIVDCSGGKRFTFRTADLSSSAKVTSDADKAISQVAALKECKGMILERVSRPNTTSFNEIIGSSYYKNETTGNVRLVLDFESKNQFDQTRKHRASCIFSASGHKEITILDR